MELSKYRFEKKWNEFLELEVIIDASVEASSIVKNETEGIETLTGIKDELPDFIDDEKNNSDNSKDNDNRMWLALLTAQITKNAEKGKINKDMTETSSVGTEIILGFAKQLAATQEVLVKRLEEM